MFLEQQISILVWSCDSNDAENSALPSETKKRYIFGVFCSVDNQSTAALCQSLHSA